MVSGTSSKLFEAKISLRQDRRYGSSGATVLKLLLERSSTSTKANFSQYGMHVRSRLDKSTVPTGIAASQTVSR